MGVVSDEDVPVMSDLLLLVVIVLILLLLLLLLMPLFSMPLDGLV